jgi:hypothetical protein
VSGLLRLLAGVCLAAAVAACQGVNAPAGRHALRCAVETSLPTPDGTVLYDTTFRYLWVDADARTFALSEIGAEAIDADWATQTREERAQFGGLAPLVGGAGAFACFDRDAQGGCAHGVDLATGRYAFATRVAAPDGTGAARPLVMRGAGWCTPAEGLAWAQPPV